MIDVDRLTETDVGRWVEYCPSAGLKGRIKSWNERWIFVVYHCDDNWPDYQNYTGAATEPNDLNFTEERED